MQPSRKALLNPAAAGETGGARPKSAILARLLASGAGRTTLFAVVVVALLALLPTLFDELFGFSADFQLHRVTLVLLFVLASFAQNILTGYAAQPSLGNAAFFGVGGYLLAWLGGDLGWPFWVAALAAIVASALLGVLVGGPALRVSGAYLAIATLGLVFIAGAIFDLWDTSAGRQSYDINNLPVALSDDQTLYFLALAIVAIILFLGAFLLRSRVGRAWVALRDSEPAALAVGINTTYYKLLAFVVSAALTGLAGALYATWAATASGSMSSVDQTIVFLAMIVVGGLGSISGSVLGALFVGALPLLLGQLPSPINAGPLTLQVSTLTTGIYGLLLLLTLILFPAGLASLVEHGRGLVANLIQRRSQA